MTPQRSALARRAAALTVTALALFAVVTPAWSAPAGAQRAADKRLRSTVAASITPTLTVSLEASPPTVPTGGTFRYTAEVRLAQRASYLQTVFEVSRPSGQLLFKRTRVENGVKRGVKRYLFERELADVLTLEPGTYPVRTTVSANIDGSTVTTETTAQLRVYEKGGTPLRVALVARVSGRPMSSPDGKFTVDPALSTGARNAVSTISRRVLSDPGARVTLAVPPVLLAEWRRLTGGYTLTDGTTVRPEDPVPLAYNSTLADLRAAIETERLELVTLGYADPNLTDLANRGLAKDVGPQYDSGISAVYQSLELTPSVGTIPAGLCVPPNEVDLLAEKGVRYVVVDKECARQGKGHPDGGAYQVAGAKLRALVVEPTAATALSDGDPGDAVERAFSRMSRSAGQPMVLRIDIDGDSFTTTDSVGAALSALEAQPWIQLANARSLRAPSGTGKVRLLAGPSTSDAPKGLWKTVAKARAYADAYYAALGAGGPGATSAAQQSLVAEGSVWAAPDHSWAGASRALEYADASLKATSPTLDGVSMQAEAITLSGSAGRVPITIDNRSEDTLSVVVTVSTSGGVRTSGDSSIQTTLPPQETYLEIPVDMQSSLSGKLSVEVSAGGLVLERETVTVRASYLDRLALGGAVAVALLGMLVFIVRRSRSAGGSTAASRRGARYTEADETDVRASSR